MLSNFADEARFAIDLEMELEMGVVPAVGEQFVELVDDCGVELGRIAHQLDQRPWVIFEHAEGIERRLQGV